MFCSFFLGLVAWRDIRSTRRKEPATSSNQPLAGIGVTFVFGVA